jgi:hypothetical protein
VAVSAAHKKGDRMQHKRRASQHSRLHKTNREPSPTTAPTVAMAITSATNQQPTARELDAYAAQRARLLTETLVADLRSQVAAVKEQNCTLQSQLAALRQQLASSLQPGPLQVDADTVVAVCAGISATTGDSHSLYASARFTDVFFMSVPQVVAAMLAGLEQRPDTYPLALLVPAWI